MIRKLARNLMLLPGWRTNRKIVVIESDDWGSIKMPSRRIYNELIQQGYDVDRDPYSKYDCLESNDDLERLFEVLSSVKDSKGNSAVLTANAVIANPDFERIRNSAFTEYHYELITKTFERYPNHNNSFNLWLEGKRNKLFIPQFHGREHLNINRWLKDLNKEDKCLKDAFEREMLSFSFLSSYMNFGYMEGLDFYTEEEKVAKHNILIDGYDQFTKLLGYASQSFIANCYVWHWVYERTLAKCGIKFIQSNPFQFEPKLSNNINNHRYKRKWHYIGEKNKFGQLFLVRNVYFEPSLLGKKNIIDDCLRRIDMAFTWGKPAIISSHRLNFIGSIFPKNSDTNLKLLKDFLQLICKTWPEVEFISSDALGHLISSKS